MTTTTASTDRMVLQQLTRVHARRFATYPLFILGAVGALLVAILEIADVIPRQAPYSMPALLIGVFGLVVAYRLTITEGKALSLLPSTPTSAPVRTLALCRSVVVPGVAGFVVVTIMFIGLLGEPDGPQGLDLVFDEGGIGYALGNGILACIGGPLLGIAVARRWRFPGAGILAAVLLVLLCFIGVLFSATTIPQTFASNLIGWIMPWAVPWVVPEPEVFYPRDGSVWGHAVYLIGLCGLAVWAAVTRGAEEPERSTWNRRGALFALIAIGGLLWALFG